VAPIHPFISCVQGIDSFVHSIHRFIRFIPFIRSFVHSIHSFIRSLDSFVHSIHSFTRFIRFIRFILFIRCIRIRFITPTLGIWALWVFSTFSDNFSQLLGLSRQIGLIRTNASLKRKTASVWICTCYTSYT
jgi:hypothetical protein